MEQTTIDRKLNLVLTYPRGEGKANLYVHATAINRTVFEQYYRVLAKAFSSIYTEAGGVSVGPRIAALEIKRAATELSGPDGEANVQTGLMAEMKRLTSVITMTETGWQTLPYYDAVKAKLLDEDEQSEVENALAFFTVVSRLHRKQDVPGVLGVMRDFWGARIVSLNSTEFTASLPMLTQDVSTGEKAAA